MKFHLSQVLCLGIAILFPSTLARAQLFQVGASETTVFEDDFLSAGAWALNGGMTISGGELHASGAANWMNAVYPFATPLSLISDPLTVYFSGRTDFTVGEERGKFYLRLNLTNEPGLIEQYNITMNIRPAGPGGFWVLYTDPGYNIPHTNETILRPFADTFPTTATYELFKLSLEPVSGGGLVATPSWWDPLALQWRLIQAQTTGYGPGNVSPLAFSAADLGANTSIASLEFQFYESIPSIGSVLVTTSAVTVAVPEPAAAIPAVIVLGFLILRGARGRKAAPFPTSA